MVDSDRPYPLQTFDEWKKNGSLLWIRGNRMLLSSSSRQPFIIVNYFLGLAGSGKSVLWYAVSQLPQVMGNLYC
jgi:hypothetical protein